MDRVLRKSGQHLYLKWDGKLTEEFEAARRFESISAAVHLCRREGLQDMEFVLRMDGDHEVVTPLGRFY